tara:strand:+ start:7480 stop:7884 length:405 start_codon:yes stop_codon:yes gene_type:complete
MYQPKVIITETMQSAYKLMLYKEVEKLCENNEPANPFKSSVIEEGEDLKVALNTTNDLQWAIRYWDDEISNENIKHVILGDPDPAGYKKEIIQEVIANCNNKSKLTINKDWIIVQINIDDNNKLVVKDSKIKVE